MPIEPGEEAIGAPASRLPDSGQLSAWAAKEVKRLTPKAAQATLLEVFSRRCDGSDLLPREDEPLPVGKGQTLRSIRTTLGSNQYRLIYFQVKPRSEGSGRVSKVALSVEARRLRFVGLLAWQKKRTNVGKKGSVAWHRSQIWLDENPGYERA